MLYAVLLVFITVGITTYLAVRAELKVLKDGYYSIGRAYVSKEVF